MEHKTQYWIVVASKDHIANGVAGGFMQANHGKKGPLKRLEVGDWVLFYSPKETYCGNTPLQAFSAIGQINDEQLYEGKMSAESTAYRRNVTFYKAEETPIAPLIDGLEFIENKRSWGFKFRFGFFEIGENDFELIRSAMIKDKLIPTDKL